MRAVHALAPLVAALTIASPVAQADTSQPVLGFTGYGGLTWGMKRSEATTRFGLKCSSIAPDDSGACETDCSELESPPVTFAFYEDKRLAAIAIGRGVRTSRGIAIGATTTQVRRAYPGAFTRRLVQSGVVTMRVIVSRSHGRSIGFQFNHKSEIVAIVAYSNDWRPLRNTGFCT